MSETPRTDADVMEEWPNANLHEGARVVTIKLARQLERELSAEKQAHRGADVLVRIIGEEKLRADKAEAMSTPTPSDTPRTDGEVIAGTITDLAETVSADFARQLERELAQAQQELSLLAIQQARDRHSLLDTMSREGAADSRALRAEASVKALREALVPFAKVADIRDLYLGPPCNNKTPSLDEDVVAYEQHGDSEAYIRVGHCRVARAALAATQPPIAEPDAAKETK